MDLKIVLGIIVGAVLFFLGAIFAFASVYAPTRLIVAALLFIVGFVVIYYATRKPKVNIQRLELSGDIKAAIIKCPHCSASISADRIKIVSGVPYATCDYCGHTFEIVEEPKW